MGQGIYVLRGCGVGVMANKGWFQHLYPKSLWGQLVSLLLLALVISQLVVLFIFVDARRINNNDIVQDRMLERIVDLANSIEVIGNRIRPNRRLFARFNNRDLQIRVAKMPKQGQNNHALHAAHIQKLLVGKLPEIQKILVSSEGPKNWMGVLKRYKTPKITRISIAIGPRLWLNIAHVQPPSSLAWIAPLLLTMVLMILFIILIVSWVVRRLTKPLGALADAAQKLGHGQNVDELTEEGTADVRHVTQSFNQMNRKIKNFIDDRTKCWRQYRMIYARRLPLCGCGQNLLKTKKCRAKY